MRTLIAFLLLLVAPLAEAIIMRHDREVARYAALGSSYPAVGYLGGVTCTLIAPRWALGAGHTVEDYFNPTGRPGVTFAGRRYEIDKIIVHPRRVHRSVDSSTDLVLLRLREPVDGIAPVLLYDRDDEPGKIVTIVGYGDTGNGLTRDRHERGKVFAARNRVEAALENSIIFTFDTPPAGLDLEGVPGPGDSGCPALLEENGKLYTLGVGSFNTGDEETASAYGTVDAFARVSTNRKWILDTIAADPPSTIPMFGAYVKTTTLPDSPAAKAATALLAAFNSGEVAKIENFYREFGRRRSDEEIRQVAVSWKELIEQYGRYELRGYAEASPHAIAVFVHATKPGIARAIGIQLEPDGEQRVRRMVMADVDEPASRHN